MLVIFVVVDVDMYNDLYTACKTGNSSAVQQLLDDFKVRHASTEIETSTDAGEFRPDDDDGVKIPGKLSRLLCRCGCGNSSCTLLHVASQLNHAAIVRLLLEHGADPSIK